MKGGAIMKLTLKDHVCDVLVWMHDKLHVNENIIYWIVEKFHMEWEMLQAVTNVKVIKID